ncbi:MAG: gfo/Idh/MocA family oxidoreductase, partial [Candidatus Cloacimonadaceae bacterium]|nr:gfo/Idh/MocA family oxidoreductase [Candidatus Cloacimonadaceae bacterium]
DMQHFDVSDTPKDALCLELESFVHCILNDTKPIVDGEAGMRALKIALEIIGCIQNQVAK